MRLPSAINHVFNQVPDIQRPRSKFDRSSTHKTAFDAGLLIPFLRIEVLPGDTFNIDATIFCRMTTPEFPLLDNLYLDVHYFFVPNRLLWTNFQRFMGERDPNPDSSIDYTIPQMVSPDTTGYDFGSLSDYLGIPPGIPGIPHSSLYHRAYAKIWNDWYRDESLQDSAVLDLDNGPDDPDDYVLLPRGKRKDYFTSALPFRQKGNSVTLPLGSSAPILKTSSLGSGLSWLAYDATTGVGASAAAIGVDGSARTATATQLLNFDPRGSLYADLSAATASTVNDIRAAFQMQRFLESDARGGTRYVEILRNRFHVVSPDFRLQRSEFLGQKTVMVNMVPVPQTSSTVSGSPQGNLAAYATATMTGAGFVKSFVEHGILLGLMSVRSDLTYQQGLHRDFSRLTRYDFFNPEFQHLGEQAILNKEIFVQGIPGTDPNEDDGVWGYQEMYGEYRYGQSQVSGIMRSSAPDSLDAWHLAQDFAALPSLDDTFIVENPPMDRVLIVDNEPQFKADIFIRNIAARPMSLYGVPGLIDHF